jgi:hypothetical protein
MSGGGPRRPIFMGSTADTPGAKKREKIWSRMKRTGKGLRTRFIFPDAGRKEYRLKERGTI